MNKFILFVKKSTQAIVQFLKKLAAKNSGKYRTIVPLVALVSLIIATSGIILVSHLSSTNPAKQKLNVSASSNHLAIVKSTNKASSSSVSKSTSASPLISSVVPSTSSKTSSLAPSSQPVIPNPPSCLKDTSWTVDGISALDLSSASPGINEVIEPLQTYNIYGYTVGQISSEMLQCSPVVLSSGTYFAGTNYDVNYQFYVASNNNGDCNVVPSSVVVGAHFSQVFPNWTPSSYDVAGLNSQWQSFYSSLQSFEQGHINIIMQYANTLLNGLQNYQSNTTDCTTASTEADTYANGVISAGYQADNVYDQSHGPAL